MIKPDYEELKRRINKDIVFYGGVLPERNAIAWRGYLVSLLEWEVMPVQIHRDLVDLLPDIPNDPITDMMHGRDD